MTNYEKLKKVIQEANPEIGKRLLGGEFYQHDHAIRLADVLLAIQNKERVRRNTLDFAEETNWNLRDNNLDHQSDECKEFLIKLLVKK